MKVGIDARSINLHSGSGIGTYTKNLIKEMINIDNTNTFDLIWTGVDNPDFKRDNTKLFFSSGRHGGFYENCYIPNLMQTECVDLYHMTQNGIGFPFDWDLNTVVTIHDLIPYLMPETVGKGYLDRFLKEMPKIINSCKGILTVSEYSKNDILKFFPNFDKEKIFVTPLAANSNFRPLPKDMCHNYLKENFGFSDPYILYIGGFSSRKNVRDLILAYEKIYKDLKTPHKLILCGSLRDEGEQLRELVTSHELAEDVLFTGYISDSILPIFYSGAEVFAYPSFYEGFGLPPLEAMSCKTAVITSNLTSIPEVTGDTAILINPFNKDELSDSLFKVLEDSTLKENLAIRGYERSLQFSWRQTATDTLNSYSTIIESLTD